MIKRRVYIAVIICVLVATNIASSDSCDTEMKRIAYLGVCSIYKCTHETEKVNDSVRVFENRHEYILGIFKNSIPLTTKYEFIRSEPRSYVKRNVKSNDTNGVYDNPDLSVYTPKRWLFNQISESEYYTKSWEEFKLRYHKRPDLDSFYQKLYDAGLYTKDKITFFNQYYPEIEISGP